MEELIQISASAFMNMVLHTFRFWSKNPNVERNIVYGLLIGHLEDNIRIIK